MTVTSFSSSATSGLALFGLNAATRQITESTYRLSTGDRFYRAGDDVAALSVSTRLRSNISTLEQAQSNNLQATSMLQTAFSGASGITSILDSMRALAVQANSGSLTAAERAQLDLEFQELRSEVDSIANGTSFNNINLLDGSVSNENDIIGATSNATQASGAITFTGAIGGGQTVVLNGVTLTEGVDFAAGGNATDTATNLFNALSTSNNAALRGVSYNLVGSTIEITSRAGGTLGEQFLIDEAGSTGAASFTVTGQATAIANVFALQGGADDGLFLGSTTVSGTIGDSLVNTQNQTVATQTLTIVDNSLLDNNEQLLRIDNGTAGGTIAFRGRTVTLVNPEDFLIGATAEETLQNLVSTIEQYSTDSDFVLNQLDFEIQGNQLIIRGRTPGNVLDQTGAAATVNEGATAAEAVISGTSLNNGTNTGVNVDGVVNPSFTGTIGGFSATFNGPDDLTASLTVGSETYTAQITDTTPAGNSVVRFNSSGGGFFDVEIAAGGLAVANQTDADTFASRLDAAFSTLTFSQARPVTNFQAAGQFAGGGAVFQSESFDDVSVDGISVTDSATTGTDAIIEFDINGETFRGAALGSGIGAFETFILRSTENANRQLRITNGNTAADLSNAANAATFETSLRNAFDLGNGDGALRFQIGLSASDPLEVTINSATSDSLFDGATPDLLSQANAAAAETVIDGALEEIGMISAGIGAAQSRLDFAYNVTESTLNELDLARGLLADTDIPSESTLFANATVQQQSAILVLAQTQALSANLLTLLEK